MKKIIYILLLSALYSNSFSQCAYDNSLYLSGGAPAVVGDVITATQTWAGDFNRVTGMQAGYTYEISTCNSATFDSEITIYPAGGGTALAYDDDGCGITGGASKVLFTPSVTGDYDILLDEFGCLHNTIDMDMTITLISTGGSSPSVLNIPVVVHVVYKNNAENISDAQIQSQIDALNRDYRKLNADFANVPSVFQQNGADMEINFCLASVDPGGNPVSGITRTQTTVPVFSHSAEPKSTANGGHDNWDPLHYLNIWVCDLDGGLLGYATFPADLFVSPNLDGVVIDYQFFGTVNATAPFNLGRTATHEVGHWLNLRHIWGDAQCGDDFVNDTPVQETANGGCPNFPHTSCSSGANGDMFMNYMDYTDDACMMMFTAGQKQRTQLSITGLRNGLANSAGCGVTSVADHGITVSMELYPNPAKESFTIRTADSQTAGKFNIYTVSGSLVKSGEIPSGKRETPISTSGMLPGFYQVQLEVNNMKYTRKLLVQ